VRGPLRQLSSAENQSDVVSGSEGTRTAAASHPSDAGATDPRPTPGLRTCRVCKETKPLTEFPLRSLIRQTRQWICLSRQRAYTKEWYQRNRDKHIAAAYVRRVRQANVLGQRIREYLCDHPCVDCGESDPDVLDFDHLRDKRADVSTLVHSAAAWEVVLAEIAKCEVRCANCHRRRTATKGRYYRTLATIARIDELAR
jgi:hypothetical protein